MNMIICDKDCMHQKEGYCRLENMAITALASDCGYYTREHSRKKQPNSLSNTAYANKFDTGNFF